MWEVKIIGRMTGRVNHTLRVPGKMLSHIIEQITTMPRECKVAAIATKLR